MKESTGEGRPLIGIVGGMGPKAGLDLVSWIIAETRAEFDQDHIPVAHFSMPGAIPNRTDFLLGKTAVHPGIEIARQLDLMASIGVHIAALACNTAHADPIFGEILQLLKQSGNPIELLHLIDETVEYVRTERQGIHRIGVLATPGTYRFRLYDDRLESAGYETVLPDEQVIHDVLAPAIFDSEWGVKGQSSPVSAKARDHVAASIAHLVSKGAEVVILGCTELALAVNPDTPDGLLIDPARIMARALIRTSYPDRLKSL